LRNTAAIQTGRDPSQALMASYWGAADDGTPQSFVNQEGSDWFWPGGGARIGNSLILFYGRIQTPSGDASGFQGVGWRAVLVSNPDDLPSQWTMQGLELPDTGDIFPDRAVLLSGDQLYVYSETGDPWHDVYLVRWAAADATAGNLMSPEWWCGSGWSTSCNGGPSVIVPKGAPELSVQPGGALAPFVMLQTQGYGAATLALRTAPAPEGPWSDAQSFFRPPESRDGETDVYAGKGHAGLTGADFVMTYVPADLYYPRFVRVNLP
jgi:hypothetical protein